jgi:hypothetical protein
MRTVLVFVVRWLSLMFAGTKRTLRAPVNHARKRSMLITVMRDEGADVEVDTTRYKLDADYKRHIHEQLGIADCEGDLDWDRICVADEDLIAKGEGFVFCPEDYPTEEAAAEALKQLIHELIENTCDGPATRH